MVKYGFGGNMKIINVINSMVFLFATALVMSIFYEGLMLKWFAIVPILILVTDTSFIIATVLNLIFNRNKKLILYLNIFSALFVLIAIIMKVFNIIYPQWGMILWNFYILYFYGVQSVIYIYKYMYSKRGAKNVL
jgi:hypothetical protein